MRRSHWMSVAVVAAAAASSGWAAQGDGISPRASIDPWPKWQGRLAVGTSQAPLGPELLTSLDAGGLKVSGASLLGDFYFSRPSQGASGSGFRATSGVFLGSRASALLGAPARPLAGRSFSVEQRHLGIWGIGTPESTDPAAMPYLGVGYTGLAKSGWGFSADFGLVALNPGSAVKLGRVFSGNQSLDDTLREMRLSPLVRLGVSYSF
jgi:hypothetical protein